MLSLKVGHDDPFEGISLEKLGLNSLFNFGVDNSVHH
jgi:hypothetical protein